jgi:hypothetical protein
MRIQITGSSIRLPVSCRVAYVGPQGYRGPTESSTLKNFDMASPAMRYWRSDWISECRIKAKDREDLLVAGVLIRAAYDAERKRLTV